MRFLQRILFIFFFILFAFRSYSQIFGGNPPSIKWRQINTSYTRVIFPKGLDSVANRITNIISFTAKPTQKTIGNYSKKINILLQNQTLVSNGYVGLGPFRSEFFLNPQPNSFEMGSIPWPDELAIHEYRHVEQYDNFNVGLSKLMGKIFGEEGRALANNAAIPNWFYEGDAVYNETNLSVQGRGNLPQFFDAYRSLWKVGKHYSWMKLRNGSLKDFVPDHYALGYLMVAYGRQKYGDEFWKNVTHDAASFKSPIYPFQHAIKKYAGVNYATFSNDAFEFFKSQFDDESEKSNSNFGKIKNEQFPSFTEDGAIIFVKSSSKEIPQFVILKNGKEEKIRAQDYSLDNYFSYRNGKIIYSSYKPDVRWGYRDFNNLKMIDITNGDEYTISNKTKYFSPDISEDGQSIIVVNAPPSGKSSLHLLNSKTGKLIKEIPNPNHLFYTYPKYYGNNKIITAVRNPAGKMSIAEIDLKNNETKFLLPVSYHVCGFPYIFNDTLYFSLAFKKNVDLFAFTFSDKKLWLLNVGKSAGIGKYHPFVNQDFVGWSTFTAEGYRLEKIKKSEVIYREINPAELEEKISNFGVTVLDNTNAGLLQKVPDDSFSVSKYPKSFRLFNFHSIEPAINDPLYTLSLVGENILNTFQSSLSLTYNRAEKSKEISFLGTYGAWFPFVSGGINFLQDRSILYRQQVIRYNQLEPFAGFSIPLNLSKGRSFTNLNFGSQYVYSQGFFRGIYKDSVSSSYSYINNFLTFNNQQQKASQQIFPSFAQSISLSYKTAVQNVNGYQFVANGNFYLPGISKTHSLVLNMAWLQKDTMNQLNFSSGFPFSRGYQALNFYNMFKWGINYHLPLAFPDKGFGNIIYLLRIRSNIFYDDTEAKDWDQDNKLFSQTFRSLGSEISFDTKWWNQVNISFGIRYSRLLDSDVYGNRGSNRWEIILPVNILNQ